MYLHLYSSDPNGWMDSCPFALTPVICVHLYPLLSSALEKRWPYLGRAAASVGNGEPRRNHLKRDQSLYHHHAPWWFWSALVKYQIIKVTTQNWATALSENGEPRRHNLIQPSAMIWTTDVNLFYSMSSTQLLMPGSGLLIVQTHADLFDPVFPPSTHIFKIYFEAAIIMIRIII